MPKSTKKVLADSLKDLLNSENFSKITISDITNHVGLNRKTFYYHFKDIYDLVEWIYVNEIVKELDIINNYNDWQQAYLFITNYILKNKKFIIATYQLSSLNTFIYKETDKMILSILNKKVDNHNFTDKDKEFIANFYSHAFVGTLSDWVHDGMKESPKEIINRINKIIEIL